MIFRLLVIVVLFFSPLWAQNRQIIKMGAFNMEWFPCKDDGNLMKKYGINLRYPPKGNKTDVRAMFSMLKDLNLQLLATEEVVDTRMVADSAKKYLGENYKYIYSPDGGSQKVGFLYDSSVLKLIGNPQSYSSVMLDPNSRLRPAFRAYFKTLPDGFDFHAIVVHLKASPRGWNKREKQWKVIARILETLPEESKDADIVLMGDMNDVTKQGPGEFLPVLKKTNFYWATGEIPNTPTNYWTPNWREERVQASEIDHIFISSGARDEYIMNSAQVGGVCSKKADEYTGDNIPDYLKYISDHCPVMVRFNAGKDND